MTVKGCLVVRSGFEEQFRDLLGNDLIVEVLVLAHRLPAIVASASVYNFPNYSFDYFIQLLRIHCLDSLLKQ